MSDFAEVPAEPAVETAALLPFAFARRFGVLITVGHEDLDSDDKVLVACKSAPNLTTLAEIKRFAGRPLQLKMVGEEEFEALLNATYARDSSEARQMVQDLGDEMDLASLADSVPETEDLLEQEDELLVESPASKAEEWAPRVLMHVDMLGLQVEGADVEDQSAAHLVANEVDDLRHLAPTQASGGEVVHGHSCAELNAQLARAEKKHNKRKIATINKKLVAAEKDRAKVFAEEKKLRELVLRAASDD